MFYKFLHIFLSLNLMISSLGLMGFEHICSINGTSFSLYVKPQKCCSKAVAKTCSASCCSKHQTKKGVSFNKKPCCEDKTHYKKLNVSATEFTKTLLSEIQPTFYNPITWVTFDPNNIVIGNEKTLRFYLYKPPPPPVEDLRVFFQSFLC